MPTYPFAQSLRCMVQVRLDDEASLCSIGILAEAVEHICVKGVLELRMLRNALREATANPTPDAVKTAFGMFARVDRDFRRMIAHEALTLAAQRRGQYGPKVRTIRRTRVGPG
ncbi:hypothetical protein [Azospirillum canadense]|uniref:hypothetical protein n=1 Tax=Azospirillum canadense TaxID=403962 RepID=UPI002227FDC1|nr:hypothetical protein [Azospirillum canadense]MCW2237334.1 hypothetical protein [Azospirillum canadense]